MSAKTCATDIFEYRSRAQNKHTHSHTTWATCEGNSMNIQQNGYRICSRVPVVALLQGTPPGNMRPGPFI